MVSTRAHLEAVAEERDKRYGAEREADQLSTTVAKKAAEDALTLHNGLIRQMKEQQATYARKDDVQRLESWQAKITGGMLILGIIGLSNLVKLWAG